MSGSIYPHLTKEGVQRELAEITNKYAPAYLASVTDVDAEVRRLTELLKQAAESWDPIRVRLKALGPECWPAALMERYRESTRWGDRFDCVNAAIWEVRASETARALGVLALGDRSYVVRERANMILAYSLHTAVIPDLRQALATEQRADLRKSLDNAIHAIERQDHTRYLDRTDRPGKTYFSVEPWESGDPAGMHHKMQWMVSHIHDGWAVKV